MNRRRLRMNHVGGTAWLVLVAMLTCAVMLPMRASASEFAISEASVMAVDASNGHLWLAQPTSNSVFVLDSDHRTVLTMLRVPSSPVAIVIDLKRKRVYIASDNSGVVTAYGLGSYKIVRRFHVGGRPSGLALISGGKQLLVTDAVSGALSALDPVSVVGMREQQWTVGPAAAPSVYLGPKTIPTGFWTNVWARGFQPGERVEIDWGVHRLSSAIANTRGIIEAPFRVPVKLKPDDYLIIVYGTRSALTQSTLLHVLAAPPPIVLKAQSTIKATKSPGLLAQTILIPFPWVKVAPVAKHTKATKKGGKAKKAVPPQVIGVRVPIVAIGALLLLLLLYLVRRLMTRGKRKGTKEVAEPLTLPDKAVPIPLKRAS